MKKEVIISIAIMMTYNVYPSIFPDSMIGKIIIEAAVLASNSNKNSEDEKNLKKAIPQIEQMLKQKGNVALTDDGIRALGFLVTNPSEENISFAALIIRHTLFFVESKKITWLLFSTIGAAVEHGNTCFLKLFVDKWPHNYTIRQYTRFLFFRAIAKLNHIDNTKADLDEKIINQYKFDYIKNNLHSMKNNLKNIYQIVYNLAIHIDAEQHCLQ